MSSVDVIVPCYNYGRFLRECVSSVLSQEGVEVRVLIIDDCSTDDSETVGRALSAEDPRVEFRRHAVNRGHIATYNEGIDWLAADYCLLLSADDVLCSGALARAAAVMDATPEIGFVYGRHVRFRDLSELQSAPQCGAQIEVCRGTSWLEKICALGRNPIACPEVLARTAIQKAVGGYSAALPHTGDLEMWLRYAARADVAVLDTFQAGYRIHGSNMSQTTAPRVADQFEPFWDAVSSFVNRERARGSDFVRLRELAGKVVAEGALSFAYDALKAGDAQGARKLVAVARSSYPMCRQWAIYRSIRMRLVFGRRVIDALGACRRWIRGCPRTSADRGTS